MLPRVQSLSQSDSQYQGLGLRIKEKQFNPSIGEDDGRPRGLKSYHSPWWGSLEGAWRRWGMLNPGLKAVAILSGHLRCQDSLRNYLDDLAFSRWGNSKMFCKTKKLQNGIWPRSGREKHSVKRCSVYLLGGHSIITDLIPVSIPLR